MGTNKRGKVCRSRYQIGANN
uniref:Uncharacterized protein n=1 Tax=Rhizophora mucronata TaxID=61149 RepID=A0A2P2P8D0_RHIMU